MYETPEVVKDCLASLREQPYICQGFRERELQIGELADYGEVVGSMLIAAVVGDITPGQEILPELLNRARHIVHLVGSVDDSASNDMLATIFGTAFMTYMRVQRNIMQGRHSGYDFSVPREVTDEDIAQAAAIDAALALQGRVYLASEEAQATIWQKAPGEKGGCPIRHARRDGESDFDRFITAQLEGYANTGSYIGPAQFILRTVQGIKPDMRAYIVENKGQVTDWHLPQLAG